MSDILLILGLIFIAILLILIASCLQQCCQSSHLQPPIRDDDNEPFSGVDVQYPTDSVRSTKKSLEKSIFEQSFELISRRDHFYLYLKNSYLNTYNKTTDGMIDWHKVFPGLKAGGNAYIAAISKTAYLLTRNWSQKQSQENRIIIPLVNSLIQIRTEENERFRDDPNGTFEGHQRVIRAWIEFKELISK